MTKCKICGTKFKVSEALCDDWRDPLKSFGCPKCGTFYKKEMRPKLAELLIGGLVGAGILTPASQLYIYALRSDDIRTLVLTSIIIVSVFTILAAWHFTLKSELDTSPYRRASGVL